MQVHSRTPPRQLLEFLLSDSAALASKTSTKRLEHSAAEDTLLAAARDALGARHVVRICSRDDDGAVAAALRRLIDNAATIRANLDLSGVCLAIDDNYHLWDSGYVSIPVNFDLSTMATEVTKLLAPAGPLASADDPPPQSKPADAEAEDQEEEEEEEDAAEVAVNAPPPLRPAVAASAAPAAAAPRARKAGAAAEGGKDTKVAAEAAAPKLRPARRARKAAAPEVAEVSAGGERADAPEPAPALVSGAAEVPAASGAGKAEGAARTQGCSAGGGRGERRG